MASKLTNGQTSGAPNGFPGVQVIFVIGEFPPIRMSLTLTESPFLQGDQGWAKVRSAVVWLEKPISFTSQWGISCEWYRHRRCEILSICRCVAVNWFRVM